MLPLIPFCLSLAQNVDVVDTGGVIICCSLLPHIDCFCSLYFPDLTGGVNVGLKVTVCLLLSTTESNCKDAELSGGRGQTQTIHCFLDLTR